MRHHGRAQDAGGEQDRSRAVEAGHEAAQHAARVGTDVQRVVKEAQQDHPQEARDRELEAAVAPGLQPEDREGDDAGDQPRGEQRHAEQEVERDRGAHELRQVGGHRDQLRLDPQAPGHRTREVLPAQLGQVAPGGDAHLGRQVLDEHRHQVRGQDHPQQQVAVLRAARDVRGEVPGVDVGDAGHEGGAQHGQRAPNAPTAADELERGRPGEGDGARVHARGRRRRVHDCTSTRIACARAPPSTCTSAPKRANSGPSNGCLSTIWKRLPGAMPRSAR